MSRPSDLVTERTQGISVSAVLVALSQALTEAVVRSVAGQTSPAGRLNAAVTSTGGEPGAMSPRSQGKPVQGPEIETISEPAGGSTRRTAPQAMPGPRFFTVKV